MDCADYNNRNIVLNELIGLRARVVRCSDRKQNGLEGTIVDETKNTLLIETDGKCRKVVKASSTFRFYTRGGVVRRRRQGDKLPAPRAHREGNEVLQEKEAVNRMECHDPKCPTHGSPEDERHAPLRPSRKRQGEEDRDSRGRYTIYTHKYERYLRKRSRVQAYNPECINAKTGDVVSIGETRRLSKTKAFVVTGILKPKVSQ